MADAGPVVGEWRPTHVFQPTARFLHQKIGRRKIPVARVLAGHGNIDAPAETMASLSASEGT